jgi:zinc/manganese transport system substrate-binding protein
MRTIIVIGILAVSSSVLAGCGSATPSHGGIAVVAAENAYGDIAQQIGGEHVRVTSILSQPDADPNLFEPDSSNGLAIATARVVIENGLGYDAFMTKLMDASPSSKRVVLTIADVLHLAGRDTNPHLWYDVPELGRIAGAIAGALERADPAHASAYRAGLARFDASLGPLRREVAHIRASYHGAPVAYTEPVAGYLVDAAGLKNLAPSAFTRAIEDGSEPTPQAFAAMTGLMTRKRVKVLLYNSQTTSPVTTRVRNAAEHAHIPVAGFSETLPKHLSFQEWQLAQARELAAALAR